MNTSSTHHITAPSLRGDEELAGPRGAGERYTRTTIVLHWFIGIALLAQLAFGWIVSEIPRHTPARGYYVNLHKSVGITLGILILLRLAWRLTHRPPAMPSFMEKWQRLAALATHRLLYVLMVAMPTLGYVASNFSEHGVKFFGHPLPPWGPDLPAVYKLLNGAHIVCAYVLATVIALHVLAALQHAVIKRDGIFWRIWLTRN
ncbi:MAG: cytochrome b [Rhodoferax sp.]